jgi:hypothetical protein
MLYRDLGTVLNNFARGDLIKIDTMRSILSA